jgi:hypothetical protein
LQSNSAWIARSFFGSPFAFSDVAAEIAMLHDRLSFRTSRPWRELLAQRDALRRHLRGLDARPPTHPSDTERQQC